MTGQARPTDAAAQQWIHDRCVIDHLIKTFHSEEGHREPREIRRIGVYDQIKRQWPTDLALGTRR